jgi:hypothetical protein
MRAFDFRPWHEMDMAGLLIMSVPAGIVSQNSKIERPQKSRER